MGLLLAVLHTARDLSCPPVAKIVEKFPSLSLERFGSVFPILKSLGENAHTSHGASWPIKDTSVAQLPLLIIATEDTGQLVALGTAICCPSGDQLILLK